MNDILVSVCCQTYNQKDFIRECLNGIVNQQTNFTFEVLVNDDASQDETTQIVKEFEERYPHLFINFYQTQNQSTIQNALINVLFRNAKGKYIALCDGDDCWLDPFKLQKQIDFLEANTDYSICGHESMVKNYLSDVNDMYFSNFRSIDVKNEYTPYNFFKVDYICQTSTIVFRNQKIFFDKKIYDMFRKCINGDMAIYMILIHYGKFYFMTDAMSVYNIRTNSFTSKIVKSKVIDSYRDIINSYNIISSFFNHKFGNEINAKKLEFFDKMLFRKVDYPSKKVFYKDLLIFVFSNRYGKMNFFKKIKYVMLSNF